MFTPQPENLGPPLETPLPFNTQNPLPEITSPQLIKEPFLTQRNEITLSENEILLEKTERLLAYLNMVKPPENQGFWQETKDMIKQAGKETAAYLKLNLLITKIVEAHFEQEGYKIRAVPLDILIDAKILPMFVLGQFLEITGLDQLAQQISAEIIGIVETNLGLFARQPAEANESLILGTLVQALLPEELQAV